jgi:hypothetical protein
MLEAFSDALKANANKIVVILIVLVAGYVADLLFHQTFRGLAKGIREEIAALASVKPNLKSLNLIGGLSGLMLFMLYAAGNSFIARMFGFAVTDAFPVLVVAAFGTWIYFLLCIAFCSFQP